MIIGLCWLATILAAIPCTMITVNLFLFRRPNASAFQPPVLVPSILVPSILVPSVSMPFVSVIVPVRNEEAAVEPCVRDLLANTGINLEVIVVDDHSEDRTASVVRALAKEDERVRLCDAPPLPSGWAGKQHACYSGASVASHPILLFVDCDVRLKPNAVAAMCGYLTESGVPLVSGFPRERTLTAGEALLIPLIHVLLLGYLPIFKMRRSAQPSLGAGCGQIMLADSAVYRRTGGHAMIRRSWHDGLQLPRAFRRAGYGTDIFDASGLAECRMYRGFAESWRGFAKNAREGMATAVALPVWTVLLGGGLVMPFVLAPFALVVRDTTAYAVLAVLSALLLARLVLAIRFRQSLLSVPLLPVGALLLLLLQWRVLLGATRGRAQVWRGRTETLG